MPKNTKTVGEVLKGFRRVSTKDKDPNWPQHTGETVWKSFPWTVIEECLGGMSARVRYTVFRYTKLVGNIYPSYSQYATAPNLKIELTKLVEKYHPTTPKVIELGGVELL